MACPSLVLPQVWELRGRYPNRGYPRIFKDETVGVEAKKLFDEAQAMLAEMREKRLLTMRGIVGIYPANAAGDDIEVYADEGREAVRARFFGLRQQAEKEGSEPYCCVSGEYVGWEEAGGGRVLEQRAVGHIARCRSRPVTYLLLHAAWCHPIRWAPDNHCAPGHPADFIAPKSTGLKDYLGMFVVSAGFGLEKLTEHYKKDHDDYKVRHGIAGWCLCVRHSVQVMWGGVARHV